jgi:hypothetical protein
MTNFQFLSDWKEISQNTLPAMFAIFFIDTMALRALDLAEYPTADLVDFPVLEKDMTGVQSVLEAHRLA